MAFSINSGWVGAIAGIIAVIVAVYTYWRTRRKPSLSYEVLAEDPLISIGEEIKGKLQILFNGNPIENVHLLLLKFTNDGNIPIAATDFEQPLTLNLESGSSILSAEYVKATPENLPVSLKVNDNAVIFDPILLNPTDSFTSKLLVGQYSGKFHVDARILGVRDIQPSKKKGIERIWYRVSIAVIFIALVVSIALAIISSKSNEIEQKLKERPPEISYLTADKYSLYESETVKVRVVVISGDPKLSYSWDANRGKIVNTYPDGQAEYRAPDTSGPDMLKVIVSDSAGRKDLKTLGFEIYELPKLVLPRKIDLFKPPYLPKPKPTPR